MSWSYRKTAKLGPLNITFSKSGVGYSLGVKYFRFGVTADGKRYTTSHIPGTGFYNRTYQHNSSSPLPPQTAISDAAQFRNGLITVGVMTIVFGLIFFAFPSFIGGGIFLVLVGIVILLVASKDKKPAMEAARKKASDLVKQGNYTEAVSLLQPFETLFPDDPGIKIILGYCFGAEGKQVDSEQIFQSLYDRSLLSGQNLSPPKVS